MTEKLVVIGNGMAPGRMLEHLFDAGKGRYDVTIFNAEPRVNYNRLMLSPVLAGEKSYQDIITHDDAWYAAHGVKLHKGEKIVEIDRDRKQVRSENGVLASYDKLVIATGSSPFVIPVEGHDLEGVLVYRDLDDVEAMIAAAKAGGRAVVIGGGLLGLEAAAGLKAQNMEVTVLHLNDTLMDRQMDAVAGSLLQEALEQRGIRVLTGANTKRILGDDGRVSAVELEDGTLIEAAIVVMAVGIRPSIKLAKDTGLDCNRGIVVDDQMRSSDPSIYALGECVEHRGQCYGLVAPLYEMAEVLANNLLGCVADYCGSVTATKLKVTGIDVFSAGDFTKADDREDLILSDAHAGVYKRLILKDERLIGAVLYGETADGPWLFDLIREGVDVCLLRKTLIFGQAYGDPSSDGSSGPDDECSAGDPRSKPIQSAGKPEPLEARSTAA